MKRIALFEIFLIVTSIVAFSSIISSQNGLGSNNIYESEIIKKTRNFLIDNLSNGLVSAQETYHSCRETLSGTHCQEFAPDICDDNCAESCVPVSLSDFADCQIGVCMDYTTGICAPNSPAFTCDGEDSEWFADAPAICDFVCCQYGDTYEWITSTACNIREAQTGIDAIITYPNTEQECIAHASPDLEGACVTELEFDPNRCIFTTSSNCLSQGGVFYEGTLCTNPDLETECFISDQTSCFEGKDDVYFIDSCGNKANVYDVTKQGNIAYWSFVTSPECSTEFLGDPLGKQDNCGNCDRSAHSTCGLPGSLDDSPTLGEFVCSDLRCVDEWGNTRDNYESWCSYDGKIGFSGEGNSGRSLDQPGTSHYKSVCNNGEIISEICGSGYRGDACVSAQDPDTGFSIAQCVQNPWVSCLALNSETDGIVSCDAEVMCAVKEISVDSHFQFDICVPQIPPGFDMRLEADDPQIEENEQLCGIASTRCVITYVKDWDGGWDCVDNCNCRSPDFIDSVNNFCMSLGDCGGHYSFGNTDDFVDSGFTYGGEASYFSGNYFDDLANDLVVDSEQIIDLTSGTYSGYEFTFEDIKELTFRGGYRKFSGDGLKEQGRAFNSIWQGAVGGAGVVSYITGALVGTVIVVFAIFLFAYAEILGVGETKKRFATFECLPWQPPAHGNDCAKCQDGDFGCTKYMCESLGAFCSYENEGSTEGPSCISIDPSDALPPVISPDYEVLTEGYEISEESDFGFRVNEVGGSCIPGHETVNIGIELDEHARCKFAEQSTTNYDEMDEYFGSNYLTLNKEKEITLPSLEELEVLGIEPDLEGDHSLYIRCIDASENGKDGIEYQIDFCVSQIPDTLPPEIGPFDPVSGSFIPFEASSMNIDFYTDEPADCRWDQIDTDYSSMLNDAICDNDFYERTIFGYRCSALLPVSEGAEDPSYFFRCLDKPWVDDPSYGIVVDGAERIANNEGVGYVLKTSSEPLIIDYVYPDNEIFVIGGGLASLDSEVRTSGGVDGSAQCSLSTDGGALYFPFQTTGLDNHVQEGLSYPIGEHEIFYECIDVAGNVAFASSVFTIEIDETSPLITRAYDDGGRLTVITDEPSTCEFSFSSCVFTSEEATSMLGNEFKHTYSFDSTLTHYIVCKDPFDNPSACLTVTGGYN